MSDPYPQVVQDLLHTLDHYLAQPLKPWRLYQQWQSQRQLMQRVRDVLSLWPRNTEESRDDQAQAVLPGDRTHILSEGTDLPQATSLDAVRQLLAPLQADLAVLVQRRQELRAEVEQLEMQRSQQQAQLMQPLIGQVEQLELFQRRAEQVLKSVDGSLQLTFQAFDQDMAAYRQSLTQQFRQFDDLGQQSEAIVSGLLQQMIQEMQRIQKLAQAVTVSSIEQLPPLPNELLPTAAPSLLPQDLPANSLTSAEASLLSPISESVEDATLELAPSSGRAETPSIQPISQLTEILLGLGLSSVSVASEATASKPAASDFILSEIPDLFESDSPSENSV